ncbi:MAG: response regulator [Desulfatirhabdiaceae bacterium]
MNVKINPDKEIDKILIVEDSPTQAEQLKYLLEQQHYRVMAAANGDQAIALLDEHRPVLIITDIIMPKMNGFELCEKIKSDKRTADIPVILLTSLTSPEDVLEGLACGADSFITKPYSKDYLLSNIQQILANSGLRKAERVRIGVEILFAGKRRFITADQQQMLSLLVSTYEAAFHRNRELVHTQTELRSLNERLEGLVKKRTADLSQEITERKQAEEKVRHFNSIIRAIRNVNQLITKEKDPDRLIRGVCETLVATRGFTSAWIMITGEFETSVYCSETGIEDAFRSLKDRLEKGDLPQCARRAMIQSSIVVTEDISAECVGCPLLSANHGKSAFSIRLEHESKVYGVLSASVPHGFALDKEEQGLFQEAGEDIAFALFNIAREEERLKVEKDLKASEERMRITIESSPIGIRINKQDGKLVYVNPALVAMFGYDSDEMSGLRVEELYRPEDRDLIGQRRQEHFDGKQTKFYSEMMGMKKSGSLFEVKNYMARIDFEKEPALLVFVIDISSEKKLEAQYLQAQKMEAIGRLAGGISHDFNNILTSIIGYGELTREALTDNTLRENIDVILKAGQSAATLIGQLLAFSRKQTISPVVLNLNDIITNLNKLITRVIGEDIEINTSLSDDLMPIKADVTQMEQVLMNLLVNAKDAMPRGGKFIIETTNIELDGSYALNHDVEISPGFYVLLKISDTGKGMDKDVQAKIFEPFFSTKEKGKGTGLGLSTVYGIVKQNNGHIWVYSEPGKGTTFKIYFPGSETGYLPDKTKHYKFDELKGNETILLVEDDEAVRSLVKKVLEKFGYTVLAAQDGDEAISLFKLYRDQIHLVVTDVIMPIMSGRDIIEVLQTLKADIKTIYMSGYTDDAIADHGLLYAGINFIEKPFSSEKLALKVRQVLDTD